MKIINFLVLPAIFLCITGCGGGGGKYFAPSVTLNSYGITKISFTDYTLGIEHRVTIQRQRMVDSSDDRDVEGHRYYYFRNIMFQGNRYVFAIPLAKWISILTPDDNIVIKLKTPRYTTDAVAVELTHPRLKPFLAVLINQQATSHSSTLYILDDTFTPIYTEHLLGAYWISKITSPEGDVLLVSCEGKWRPDGEWKTIGGNWRYNIFEKIKE